MSPARRGLCLGLAAVLLSLPPPLRAKETPAASPSPRAHRYSIGDLERADRPPWWERAERPLLLILSFGLIAAFPASRLDVAVQTDDVTVRVEGSRGKGR